MMCVFGPQSFIDTFCIQVNGYLKEYFSEPDVIYKQENKGKYSESRVEQVPRFSSKSKINNKKKKPRHNSTEIIETNNMVIKSERGK